MGEEILAKEPLKPDARIHWGAQESQFGDLFLPGGTEPHPVVVAIHGGFWRKEFDLEHLSHLCAALARSGYAVWSLEYRRLGQKGGGWPGTFADAAAGTDHLHRIAAEHRLDLDHVVSLGHSAGGHLALWLGARKRLPPGNPFQPIPILPLRGVVGLAAVSDLAQGFRLELSDGVVDDLLGGSPAEVPARYALASPAALLPLGVPQRIVHGEDDDIVPFEMSAQYFADAKKAGDPAVLDAIGDAGHFELIDPASNAWPAVLGAVRALI
jgi:acetyl esterase/lipase